MERIWWENVPNAARFVERIAEGIHDEKSMLLILPPKTPWRNFLPSLIEEKIADIPDRSLRQIDCPKEAPGSYLLEHFCMEEKRLAYRGGKSHAEFLAHIEGIVLHTAILWITIECAENARAWMEFIREYQSHMPKDAARAVFLLALDQSYGTTRDRKGLQYHALEDEVNEFDRFAFAILAASSSIEQKHLKYYLASLSSTLCGNDIELSAACNARGREFLKKPLQTLKNIADQEIRSDGRPFDIEEILKNAQSLLWKTQIKTVFPVLEDCRSNHISRCRSQLEAMHIDPEDVELGSLCHYALTGAIRLPEASIDELDLLKNARNKLAHLEPLPLETVDAILKKCNE